MTTCIFCSRAFESPATQFCRDCYFAGRSHEAERSEVMAALRAIDGIARANITHTGGNNWALEISFADGRYGFATAAIHDGTDWITDSFLPDFSEGDRWALGIYASQEAFDDEAAPQNDFQPLTNDELIAQLQERAQ